LLSQCSQDTNSDLFVSRSHELHGIVRSRPDISSFAFKEEDTKGNNYKKRKNIFRFIFLVS